MGSQQREKNRQRRQLEQNRQNLDKRKKLPGYPLSMGGRTFYLLPPGREGVRKMEEFILANRKSPLDIAKSKLDGLTPQQQENLLRDALARESSMPNSITEADFAQAIDSREGAAMMFWLMVRKNHPELAQDQIETVLDQATDEEFQKFLSERDEMVSQE